MLSLKWQLIVGIPVLALLMTFVPVGLYNYSFPFADKIAHILASGLIVLFLTQMTTVRKSVLITFLFLSATEIAQHFIPYRSFELLDFLANGIGVIVAWGLISIHKKRILQRT